MLEQILVNNSAGDLLELSLSDPSNGFAVESIQGLDPVKATIVSSSYATLDGGQFQNAKNEPRNIRIRLGLEPDYVDTSVLSLRQTLYKYFMPKMKVTLQFYDDVVGLNTYDISGYVESMESELFSSEPAVDISILCMDPDFVAHDETVFTGSSTVDGVDYVTLAYEGTVDAGFVFQLDIDRTLTEFSIRRAAADGTRKQMDFAYPFVAGDVLYVSTVPGNKYVELDQAGTRTSILYSLARLSQWINLEPGNNEINVDTGVGASIDYSITYNDRFGGL